MSVPSEMGRSVPSEGAGTYFEWPDLTDVFPWQQTGSVMYRAWPVGETKEVLSERWRSLLAGSSESRRQAFKETRDRKVNRQYRSLMSANQKEAAIASIDANTPVLLSSVTDTGLLIDSG